MNFGKTVDLLHDEYSKSEKKEKKKKKIIDSQSDIRYKHIQPHSISIG